VVELFGAVERIGGIGGKRIYFWAFQTFPVMFTKSGKLDEYDTSSFGVLQEKIGIVSQQRLQI